MTATTETAPADHRCLSCGRKITSAESVAARRGSGCRAKIRKAAKQADLSAWTPGQVDDARELIEDGGIVPAGRPDVFWTVSSDGSEVHLTHRDGCNCPAGLKTRQGRPCYHRCAVEIVLASHAPVLPARSSLDKAA
jgi:hypothetical protein